MLDVEVTVVIKTNKSLCLHRTHIPIRGKIGNEQGNVVLEEGK